MRSGFIYTVGSGIDPSQLLRRIESRSIHRVSAKISRGDVEFTCHSSAWSLSIDGLVDYKIPYGLQLTKWDAIALI